MLKISGLDKLSRQLGELQKVMSELDGDIAEVKIDPFDPESIERAINDFETAVDQKADGYSRNDMVQNIISAVKENGRASILEKAEAARLGQKGHE